MKKEMTRDDVCFVELELLEQFDAFCKQQNIKYFLSNGTLLGAVKYKGIIPWDDDIDVLVPREDYQRLINIYKDTPKYRLFSMEKCPEYRYPFAKLCDMDTRKEEENIDNGVELGIDIDVFPLDSWNTNRFVHLEAMVANLNYRFCSFSKMRENPKGRLLKRFAWHAARCVRTSCWLMWLCKRAENVNKHTSNYVGCVVWPVYGRREVLPVEVFEKSVSVEFEGRKYPAPVGYDVYLSSLYGEYLKDPPIEKQCTHHVFRAYRLNNVLDDNMRAEQYRNGE